MPIGLAVAGLKSFRPTPRMKMRGLAAVSSVLICRPGARFDRSRMVETWRSCRVWAERAVTETGTSWRFSARFWAVTITSCTAGGASGCGGGVVWARAEPPHAMSQALVPTASCRIHSPGR